jgi:hypothetical protein
LTRTRCRSSVASTQGGYDEDVERNVVSEVLGADALNFRTGGAGELLSPTQRTLL